MRSTYTSTCFLATKAQRLFKQYKLLTNIEVLSFASLMFDVLYTSEYVDIDSNTMFKVNFFKIYSFCKYSIAKCYTAWEHEAEVRNYVASFTTIYITFVLNICVDVTV